MSTFDRDCLELGSRVRMALRNENDTQPRDRVYIIVFRGGGTI